MNFITHQLGLEADVAERGLIMYGGKVMEIGTNADIYGMQGPSHPYTEKLLGAIPRLHEKIRELAFIPGSPVDLLNPPAGCRFHPRCHYAFDRCKKEAPPLIELSYEHRSACWRNQA